MYVSLHMPTKVTVSYLDQEKHKGVITVKLEEQHPYFGAVTVFLDRTKLEFLHKAVGLFLGQDGPQPGPQELDSLTN